MTFTALLLIILASSGVGLMGELRKVYQVKNGTGIISTALFMLFFNVIAAAGGLAFSEAIPLNGAGIGMALIFAVAALVTAVLCLVGTAWGNVSVIVACAMLGKLILPSAYGMIVLPEENVMTIAKGLGFLFAFITLFLNFVPDQSGKKNEHALKFKLACLIVFFTQGSALIIYNLVTRMGLAGNGFVTLYMAISAILTGIAMIVPFVKNKSVFRLELKNSLSKTSIFIMIGYAVLNFVSDKLSLTCSGMVPLIFQAPVEFCVPILVIALIDFIIYREKLTKRQLIQLLTAFFSCGCFLI